MATFHEIDSLRFEHKTLMSLIVLSMFSAFFDIKKQMGREKIKEASKILNNVSFGSSFNSLSKTVCVL